MNISFESYYMLYEFINNLICNLLKSFRRVMKANNNNMIIVIKKDLVIECSSEWV